MIIRIYDGMRVIQERDGSNWPQVAYTRGLDLSGTFEGAGGIGGLLARSHEFTNCSPTITYCLTNASGYGIEDLAVWDNGQTYVTGVWVGTASGDTWSYSFPGVPGRTYYVLGLSQDYYYIQVFADQFPGTLENRGVYFDTSGGVTVTDWGQPLCDGGTSGRWLTHNYYHADGNGNVTCLMNPNDTLVASYRYDPYGNTLAQSGALADANSYRFSSKEFHPASGLYYYGYRFYVPSLQRWVNRDPINEVGFRKLRMIRFGSEEAEINGYMFVRNRPVNVVDTFGLRDWGLLGGKCCNSSKGDEWVLVGDGAWRKLKPGECTGAFEDCDGMTCGGGFYYVSNLEGGNCAHPGKDSPPYNCRRWTPLQQGPNAQPPVWDPVSGKGRGSQQGNTPPGYPYGPRRPE